MGREDKRLRERIVRQLEQRLRRKPTEAEVEQAIADLREAKRKAARRPHVRKSRAIRFKNTRENAKAVIVRLHAIVRLKRISFLHRRASRLKGGTT